MLKHICACREISRRNVDGQEVKAKKALKRTRGFDRTPSKLPSIDTSESFLGKSNRFG